MKHKKATIAAVLSCVMAFAASAAIVIPYQGRVSVNGNAFTGVGEFRFALSDENSTTNYWISAQPGYAAQIDVVDGEFDVRVGDSSIQNMADIPDSVFTNDPAVLRVWFSDGSNPEFELTPPLRLLSVPYSVSAQTVCNGSITTSKLADGAVTYNKIASGAVGQAQLASGAVASWAIAPGAVTSSALANEAVTGANIASNAIDAANIKSNAIEARHLSTLCVSESAIQDGAVTSSKIASGAVGSLAIASGAVGSPAIADYSIGTDKLITGAVTSEKIANGTISAVDIASNAVETAKIADNAVTAEKIAAGTLQERVAADGGSLSMTGTVTAAQFKFPTSRTFTYMVHGSDFFPDDGDNMGVVRYLPTGAIQLKGEDSEHFYASLNLPQGAVVTHMELLLSVIIHTNDTYKVSLGNENSEFNFKLVRFPIVEQGPEYLGYETVALLAPETQVSEGGTDIPIPETNTIAKIAVNEILAGFHKTINGADPIDNSSFVYGCEMYYSDRYSVDQKDSYGAFKILGLRIDYELQELQP